MKNSESLYLRARSFQDRRKSIIDKYESKMKSLEKMNVKGTSYHSTEAENAAKERDASLRILRDEYQNYFNSCLSSMEEANKKRTLTPPTDDELRLLQLLKMRETPTETELTAAAHTLKGNPTCLAVLEDIAHRAGIPRSFLDYAETKQMPIEKANTALRGLASSLKDFMENDTTKSSRAEARYHTEHYGGNSELTKRALFENKADCFKELTGFSGDSLTAFLSAVDGE